MRIRMTREAKPFSKQEVVRALHDCMPSEPISEGLARKLDIPPLVQGINFEYKQGVAFCSLEIHLPAEGENPMDSHPRVPEWLNGTNRWFMSLQPEGGQGIVCTVYDTRNGRNLFIRAQVGHERAGMMSPRPGWNKIEGQIG